jgi:hypothetical protein
MILKKGGKNKTMTLWINDDSASYRIINDLLEICPDNYLQIGIGEPQRIEFEGEIAFVRMPGEVHFRPYGPSISSVGTNLLADIINSSYPVFIRGVTTNTEIVCDAMMGFWGGVACFEEYGHAQIIYDVDDCYGEGTYYFNQQHNTYHNLPYLTLMHELAHIKFHLYPSDPEVQMHKTMTIDPESGWLDHFSESSAREELYAIFKENQLLMEEGSSHQRSTDVTGYITYFCGDRYITQPDGFRDFSGESPDPVEVKVDETEFLEGLPTGYIKPGCFVATAAFDSPLDPYVEFLRYYRDKILRSTRTGKQIFDDFYKQYHRFSPFVVKLMKNDPKIKNIIKWGLVTPIIHFFLSGYELPDAPIKNLEEPWKSYISKLQKRTEQYSLGVLNNLGTGLPKCFLNLSPSSAAREIGLILKLILRREKSKNKYLSSLEDLKQIPLKVSKETYMKIEKELILLGRTEREIKRIIECKGAELIFHGAHGFSEPRTMVELIDGSRIYKLHVINQGSHPFFQINVAFEKIGLLGLIIRENFNVVPIGSSITYPLCPVEQLGRFSIATHWIEENGSPAYQNSQDFTPFMFDSPLEGTILITDIGGIS